MLSIRMINFIKLLERILIFSFAVLMIGLYGFNVFIREVLPEYASTFAWIDEASRILMVWMVFLSLGLALEKGRHISMNTFLNSLSPNLKFFIHKIISLSGFCFSTYLIYLAYKITLFVFNSGQVSPTLNIPMFYLYLAPTFGFILLGIRYFLNFFNFNQYHELKKVER